MVIIKSDNKNSVVIVDTADYLDGIENFLNNTDKFEKINLKHDGILSLLSTNKNALTIFSKSLSCLDVHPKKQGDLLNQLGRGQM